MDLSKLPLRVALCALLAGASAACGQVLDTIINDMVECVMKEASAGSAGPNGHSQDRQNEPVKANPATVELFEVIEKGDVALARKLLARTPDLKARNELGMPFIVVAAGYDQRKIMEHLVVRGAGIDDRDTRGNTALHIASVRGFDETVRWLLQKGAHVNARNNAGQTPLFWAVDDGHCSTVKLLMKNGADTSMRDTEGNTPLGIARSREYDEIIRLLSMP